MEVAGLNHAGFPRDPGEQILSGDIKRGGQFQEGVDSRDSRSPLQ